MNDILDSSKGICALTLIAHTKLKYIYLYFRPAEERNGTSVHP